MEIVLLPKSFILPGQPTRYARDVPFKIEHLKLELDPDFESKKILAKSSFKIGTAGKPISHIELDAVDLNFKSIIGERRETKYRDKA